jgi:hypothetical protein
LFRRGRKVLGKNAGGLIKHLLKAKHGIAGEALAAIEIAAGKGNAREWIGGVVRKLRNGSDPDPNDDPSSYWHPSI